MKNHFVACLGLCLLPLAGQAQWANQRLGFAADTAPVYLDAIDASTAWAVGIEVGGNYAPPQVARTLNAGQTWAVSTLPVRAALEESCTALTALNATTAWITTANGAGGGRILRSTDGGLTWTPQGSAAVYGSPDSAPGLIRFFSATDGLTVGAPLVAGGPLEMYTTRNAGLTWTPQPASPATLPWETLAGTAPAVVGNNIWFVTGEGRVFHSPDQGLTWTVASVSAPFASSATVAFRDAQNGLLSVADSAGTQHALYGTADGGGTWTPVPYTGPLHGLGLSRVPGTALYISTGANVGSPDQGSSYSADNGQTWVALESVRNHLATEFVGAGVGWSGSFTTQGGAIVGSINRFSGTALAARPGAAQPRPVGAWPNPATGGRCTLPARQWGGAVTVRVLDGAGRLVQQHAWAPATALALDLSRQPAGLYVVELQTADGSIREKIIIE